MDVKEQLDRAARERFGWQRLRPEQMTAMRALMEGRDALVVAPTGAGKSAVYQVPATLLDGPTLVVSPLLALQQDQIAALVGRDDEAVAAVWLSSAESAAAHRAAVERLHSGDVEYVFVTPEHSYLQEIGRAGRDGEPSQALLLFRTEDTGLRRFFTGGTPSVEDLTRLASVLAAADRPAFAAGHDA